MFNNPCSTMVIHRFTRVVRDVSDNTVTLLWLCHRNPLRIRFDKIVFVCRSVPWKVVVVVVGEVASQVLSDCRRPLSTRAANITLSSQLPDLSRYLWPTEKVSCRKLFHLFATTPATPSPRRRRHPCHLITLP